MKVSLGNIEDYRTLEEFEEFLDENKIFGEERIQAIESWKEGNKIYEDILERLISYLRNVRYQMDIPPEQNIVETFMMLNMFLDDDEKITAETSIEDALRIYRRYLKIKSKEYFKD